MAAIIDPSKELIITITQEIRQHHLSTVSELFRSAIKEAATYDGFNESVPAEERETEREYVIRKAKQLFGQTIKQHITCCSLPVEVSGHYLVDTGEHFLAINCNRCGFQHKIGGVTGHDHQTAIQ